MASPAAGHRIRRRSIRWRYYLVSTSNPDGNYLESNKTNNSAWVKFTLGAGSNGNRKITLTAHSPCDSPGLCGEVSANR